MSSSTYQTKDIECLACGETNVLEAPFKGIVFQCSSCNCKLRLNSLSDDTAVAVKMSLPEGFERANLQGLRNNPAVFRKSKKVNSSDDQAHGVIRGLTYFLNSLDKTATPIQAHSFEKSSWEQEDSSFILEAKTEACKPYLPKTKLLRRQERKALENRSLPAYIDPSKRMAGETVLGLEKLFQLERLFKLGSVLKYTAAVLCATTALAFCFLTYTQPLEQETLVPVVNKVETPKDIDFLLPVSKQNIDVKRAMDIAHAFLSQRFVEEAMDYCFLSAEHQASFSRYWKVEESYSNLQFSHSFRGRNNNLILNLAFEDENKKVKHLTLVKNEEGTIKVDWKNYIGLEDITLSEHIESSSPHTVKLRIPLSPSKGYNKKFEEDKYFAYSSKDDGGHTAYFFVRKDSSVSDDIINLITSSKSISGHNRGADRVLIEVFKPSGKVSDSIILEAQNAY